jgi:phosphatidylserine decarboxylase
MAQPKPLPVWDRPQGKLIKEWMEDSKGTYETKPRRSPMAWLQATRPVDWAYSAFQNSRMSKGKIEPFIKKHKIDMSEFEPVIYRSYSEFFTRRFRDGMRKFPTAAGKMGAFAEARYFGWEKLDIEQELPIKHQSISAERLLQDANRARTFREGPVLLARLAPVDYHHVHYPDEGTTTGHTRLGRSVWTVNWQALQSKPDILFKNERAINYLKTKNFGQLAFVEIGAMTVGRIVQVHSLEIEYERGAEKSFFCFGGSAIVVFGEPGAWCPSKDILENTEKCIETRALLGDTVASR